MAGLKTAKTLQIDGDLSLYLTQKLDTTQRVGSSLQNMG